MAEKTETVIIQAIPVEKISSSRHQARKVFAEYQDGDYQDGDVDDT